MADLNNTIVRGKLRVTEDINANGNITGSSITGNGSGLTNLNASNISSGTLSADRHYSPTADSESELTATLPVGAAAGAYAKDTEYTVLTGVKAQRDAKGHVTGLTYTAQKIKDTNTTYTFNGAVSTIKDSNLTASRALISDNSGKIAVSDVTSAELSYLDGVTSSIQTQLNAKLDKTTYEWNKEFAAGSNGAISLGRYNIYDSQLTFDITSTTYQSLSGKLVIATQNGTIHQAKVFGDASGALVSKLIIYQSAISNSRSWVEVFCNFDGWSKNKVHIYAVALNSATVQKQMTSVTISNGVPAAANVTSGDTKWTGTIVNDFSHSHGISIATSSGTNQLTLAHGTKYSLTAGGKSFIFTTPSDNNTSHGHSAGVGLVGSGNAGTSGTYTYKAKLRSETALTVDSAAATASGRVYPVAVDKSGYLSLNVPLAGFEDILKGIKGRTQVEWNALNAGEYGSNSTYNGATLPPVILENNSGFWNSASGKPLDISFHFTKKERLTTLQVKCPPYSGVNSTMTVYYAQKGDAGLTLYKEIATISTADRKAYEFNEEGISADYWVVRFTSSNWIDLRLCSPSGLFTTGLYTEECHQQIMDRFNGYQPVGNYALKNEIIAKSLTSTKGDMIYASAASTPTRLGIGSNGQFLSVANGIPTWVTPPIQDNLTSTSTTDPLSANQGRVLKGLVDSKVNSGDLVELTLTDNGNKRYLIGSGSAGTWSDIGTNSKVYTQSGSLYATYFYGTSDRRLKENIKDLDLNCLDLVNNINLREFSWKADKEHKPTIGAVAQELRQVLPEKYVHEFIGGQETDDEYLSINDSKLVYLLIGAIQEQQKEIENLKAKIDGKIV